MKKIFKTKKQRKKELKEQSVFGYFTMNRDIFGLYLGDAKMELIPLDGDYYGNNFYTITASENRKYPYLLYYEVKPLNSAIDMKYQVTLYLTQKELEVLKEKSSTEEARLYHVKDVTMYDKEQVITRDFFDLSEEEIEEININLFASFSMIANYNFVPSPADGEFGTCYKRIRQ